MWMFGLAVCLCTLSTVWSGVFSGDEEMKIASFVEDVMECRGMPGLTLGVVRSSESWTRGFGMADRENGIPVSPRTLFNIGSVTKAFTTSLMAILINDTSGRLSWSTKVKDILGSDFAFVDDHRTRETTLKDILTHRTGLKRIDLVLFSGYNETISREELAKRTRFLPEIKPFRDGFEYNNWLYGLAGHVVEVMSGDTYEKTLENRLLKPLGMTNTRVLGKTASTKDPDVAKPYYNIDNELVLTDDSIYNIYPEEAAGAIISSADDMVKWLHFIVRQGRSLDNSSLVDSKVLTETFKTHQSLPEKRIKTRSIFRPTFPAADVSFGYGYAWVTGSYKGHRKIWHSGGLFSYITYLYVYPDLDTAVFLSVNGPGISGTGTGLLRIQEFIADIILGDNPWLNKTTACSFPEPWRKPSASSKSESNITNSDVTCLECYTGNYGHQLYGDLEVKVQAGSHTLMMQFGRLKGTLNSTNDPTKFKLYAMEPYRLLSYPGNKTNTIDVAFSEMVGGTYNRIDVKYRNIMSFFRNVSFKDDVNTSGQETAFVHSLWETTAVALICYLLLMV